MIYYVLGFVIGLISAIYWLHFFQPIPDSERRWPLPTGNALMATVHQ